MKSRSHILHRVGAEACHCHNHEKMHLNTGKQYFSEQRRDFSIRRVQMGLNGVELFGV
jgi:hypothetical protein